ncbi:unnamed protein product, partial [Caretta caretta]
GGPGLIWKPNSSGSTMAWAPLLLPLLTYCSGSLSQFTLTQPPSMSVSLGNTVQLSCTIRSGYPMTHATWHQQKIGNAPKYLLWYKSNAAKHQGSGVPSRFSGSKDAANTTIKPSPMSKQMMRPIITVAHRVGLLMLHSDAARWRTSTKPLCSSSPS